jgi:hypothetical protein
VSAASFAQMEIALHLGDLAEGSRDDFDQLIPTARVRRCHRAKAVR